MPDDSSNPLLQKLVDKFNNSRFFTISLILHLLIIAVFGTTVLFEAIQEPPDFEGEGGGFVSSDDAATAPPAASAAPQETTFTVSTPPTNAAPMNAITTMSAQPLDFTMTQVMTPQLSAPTSAPAAAVAPAPAAGPVGQMSAGDAAAIGAFTSGWGRGRGTGSGTGLRQREFEFEAFIGRYDGGNWNSTVRVVGDQITGGSLPNLLYFISKQSREKIKTNERNVKAIRLDSDQIFADKPPFIFITGSRDFKLTDKEVENLRKYVRMGGCIWGDSSVPGKRSRFDIAFRREMKRVIPDVDKNFEPLPANHPIFSKAYYSEVRGVPPGLNFYQEPVYALRIFGEIAILYTANDYGDMWQIGLDGSGQIDLGVNELDEFVAINPAIWDERDLYLNNLTQPSILQSYKFGVNIIVHLLTRWEDKVSGAGPRL